MAQHQSYGENIQNRHIHNKYDTDPTLTDAENTVYVHKRKKKLVWGLRGSHTAHDWIVSDGAIAYETLHPGARTDVRVPRERSTITLYKKNRKKYPDHKIIMAGHSLAGHLVKDVLKHTNDPNLHGYGFNSAPHKAFDNDVANGKHDSRFTAYRTRLDPVSAASLVHHQNTNTVPWAVGNPHSSGNFINLSGVRLKKHGKK